MVDLWIVIGIIWSLTIYYLFVNFNDVFRQFFGPIRSFPIVETLSNVLFFWSLGLLWVAYRRWRAAVVREHEYLTIFASTGPDVVLVIDPRRRIIRANDSVCAVFGYTAEEVLGRTTDTLYGDRRQDKRGREVFETLERIGFHKGEAMATHKNGHRFPVEITTAVLKSGEGAVLMVQDISERKAAEQRLQKAKEDLESADAAKQKALVELQANYQRLKQLEGLRDNLLHMIVHDMKTPLQVVTLRLELLVRKIEDSDGPRYAEELSSMLSYMRHLDAMVRSVLDVKLLESGRLPLRLETAELQDTVRNTLAFLGDVTNFHSVVCEAQDIPERLSYDPEIVQRVLVNLLSNAVKYTPEGEEIRVRVFPADGVARVEVVDHGPGVPESYRERIFEKFCTVEGDQQRRRGSCGLGLAFCRMAIEAHGGRIGVESPNGTGSTFWFTLPFARDPVAVPATHA